MMSSPSHTSARCSSSIAISSASEAAGSRMIATVPFIRSDLAPSSNSAPPPLARRIAGSVFERRGSSAKLRCSDLASSPSSRAMAMRVPVSGSLLSIENRRRSWSSLVSIPSLAATETRASRVLDDTLGAACARCALLSFMTETPRRRGDRVRPPRAPRRLQATRKLLLLDQAVLAQNAAQPRPGRHQGGGEHSRVLTLLVCKPLLGHGQLLGQGAGGVFALETADRSVAFNPGRDFLALFLRQRRTELVGELRIGFRHAT